MLTQCALSSAFGRSQAKGLPSSSLLSSTKTISGVRGWCMRRRAMSVASSDPESSAPCSSHCVEHATSNTSSLTPTSPTPTSTSTTTTGSSSRSAGMKAGAGILPSAAIAAATLLVMADAALAEGEAGAPQLGASGFSAILQNVLDYASSLGDTGGAAVFIAAYVAATVLFVPGSLLTLAAGALFGPLRGTAIVSVASTLGAVAAFCVARYGARPWVEEKLAGNPKARAVVAGVSKEGGKLVLLLRLSPLVPFTLLNYALGLTEVSLPQYALASWAGMLPGTFAYVYLGGAGRAAIDAAGASEGVPPEKLAIWGIGVVATLAATKLISSAAGKALAEAEASTATAAAGGSAVDDKGHK